MRTLYDLLCCPVCKAAVTLGDDHLLCSICNQRYPIINGKPVLFPGGVVPEIQHEAELGSWGTYYPWIHRLVLQSLLDDQVVIEIGSGNVAIDDPCIIRTDVRITPHVDVVCDAHALPFRSETVDFVFSLAVFEHLRQPFETAEEIRRVLKDGGYSYQECNFVFAYHGYPHHYFNASMNGMDQLFRGFTRLRSGIAPYQMPSFAIQMLLITYLQRSTISQHPWADEFRRLLEQVLESELVDFDKFFTEADAAYVAAGSYWFGMRQDHESSSILPQVLLDIWREDKSLQSRFPAPYDLARADNLLLWAKTEGRRLYSTIDEYLTNLQPFAKREAQSFDRSVIRAFPVVEPRFGTLWDYPEAAPPRKKPAPSPNGSKEARPLSAQNAVSAFQRKGLRQMLRDALS